jgi:hypothetical protein
MNRCAVAREVPDIEMFSVAAIGELDGRHGG